MIRIKTYNSLEPAFKTEWELLWRTSPYSHCYNSPSWLLACNEAFSYSSMRIIAAFTNDTLVGVLPLVKIWRFGTRVWENPGGPHLGKSSLLVDVRDTEAITALFAVARTYGSIVVSELSEEASAALLHSEQKWNVRVSSSSWMTNLDAGSYDHMSHHNSSRLQRIQRNEGAALTMQIFRGRDAAEHFAEMIAVERASFKSRDGRDVFYHPHTKKLYESLLQQRPEHVLLSLLYHNGLPIAYHFGMTYQSVYEGFQTAYNADYRRLMPGKILIARLFEALKADGIKTVDLGRGEQPAKLQFANLSTHQFTALYARHAFVRWYLLGMSALRNVWNMLPEKAKKYPRSIFHKAYPIIFSGLS